MFGYRDSLWVYHAFPQRLRVWVWIPGTHVKASSGSVFITSVLGVGIGEWDGGPQNSLAIPSSQMRSSRLCQQTNKKTNKQGDCNKDMYWPLASLLTTITDMSKCTCTHMWVHAHIYTHTGTHTLNTYTLASVLFPFYSNDAWLYLLTVTLTQFTPSSTIVI